MKRITEHEAVIADSEAFTKMAASGDAFGEILTAGEWRSKAFLRYVGESSVDQARLLADTVDESSEDEEQLAPLPVL